MAWLSLFKTRWCDTHHLAAWRAVHQRREEDRYAMRVSMERIEKEGYNLNISRYISTAEAQVEIDLHAVNETLVDVQKKIELATKKHNEFLKELGLPILPM
jgi:type I restriction enzyme M protein